MANPKEWERGRLAWPERPVSQQVLPGLWLRVLEEQAKRAFLRKIWGRTERSRKQLLSRRRGRLFDPPSVSAHLPAAV
ncbi:MAG: hypothetical protein WA437_05115 [Candidatus Sulfotelmatobacter sp.]